MYTHINILDDIHWACRNWLSHRAIIRHSIVNALIKEEHTKLYKTSIALGFIKLPGNRLCHFKMRLLEFWRTGTGRF